MADQQDTEYVSVGVWSTRSHQDSVLVVGFLQDLWEQSLPFGQTIFFQLLPGRLSPLGLYENN